jgi:hypothetical protein
MLVTVIGTSDYGFSVQAVFLRFALLPRIVFGNRLVSYETENTAILSFSKSLSLRVGTGMRYFSR